MQLVAAGVFGEVPEAPAELMEAAAEAEWLEQWRAGLIADAVVQRLFGKR